MLMEAIRHSKTTTFPIVKALVDAKEKEGAQALKSFLNTKILRTKNDERTPLEVANELPEKLNQAITKYLIEKGAEE